MGQVGARSHGIPVKGWFKPVSALVPKARPNLGKAPGTSTNMDALPPIALRLHAIMNIATAVTALEETIRVSEIYGMHQSCTVSQENEWSLVVLIVLNVRFLDFIFAFL